jgi:peptide/nickel transport system permease protein
VLRYILQRLLLLIPLLLGISVITFAMVHLAPGDPLTTQFGLNPRGLDQQTIERLREQLGLNDPLAVQYARYLGNLLHGDMGKSLTTRMPVAREVLARFPATLQLTIASMAVVLLTALPLGILSAVKHGSPLDSVCRMWALLGVSMPSFWLGIMLMLLFALELGWLPSSGRGEGSVVDALKSLVLPALTLGTGLTGLVTRITRSSMLEVLSQDYIRTAQAKGLTPGLVLVQHGLRNALIPVLTLLGLQFASLLGGAVIVETVFAWPGMGRLVVNAIWRRDYPVIVGTVLVSSVAFVLTNLVVDVLYTVVDPRIRYD